MQIYIHTLIVWIIFYISVLLNAKSIALPITHIRYSGKPNAAALLEIKWNLMTLFYVAITEGNKMSLRKLGNDKNSCFGNECVIAATNCMYAYVHRFSSAH